MYKDGKHWVAAKISTVAGVALFSTMILGGGHVDHVSADVVSASQVSRVTSDASSVKKASVATRDAKQAQPMNLAATSSSKAAINVDVPHSGLDSAVANAKKDGVQVTQGATQSSSADANHANSAESSLLMIIRIKPMRLIKLTQSKSKSMKPTAMLKTRLITAA